MLQRGGDLERETTVELDGTAEADAERAGVAAAPRIYYLSPLLAGTLADWPAQFERIAALGFDGVLLAPPFATGPSGDMFLPADFAQMNAALGAPGPARPALARIAAACRAAGLAPLLDVVLDRVAAGSPLARAHPELFADRDPAAALDPRGPGGNFDAAPVRAAAPELAPWWSERLGEWADCGFAGFRLLSPASLPAPSLRALIDGARRRRADLLFLGWTPGSDPRGLAGAGLDYVFSSLPWWDFREGWFWDELEALRRVAPVIAAPEAPFGPRLMETCHDPALARATYERNALFAATVAAGWMLPMGYEYAATRRLHSAGDTPAQFAQARASAAFDLTATIRRGNRLRQAEPALATPDEPILLGGGGRTSLALLRGAARRPRPGERPAIVLTNTDPARRQVCSAASLVQATGGGFSRFSPVLSDAAPALAAGDSVVLDPGQVLLYRGEGAPPRLSARPPLAESAALACLAPRIGIEAVTPSVEGGLFPAKRLVGETVTVEADVIADGHDVLGVALQWRAAADAAWTEARMRPLGNDRWQASFNLSELGTYLFNVVAWRDAFGTFRDELAKKHAAGVDTRLEIREGVRLVQETAASATAAGGALPALEAALAAADEDAQRAMLLSSELLAAMQDADPKPFAVQTEAPLRVLAERTAAGFASWYEVFPRSLSDDPNRHGNFDDVIRHLPRVRGMGFDVLYFPPIHPIGRVNRKGRNNSLRAEPGDPGSPYAIGSAEGGHDALHPELGTLADFRRMIAAAARHGIEIAIDFAIQCSPDHPWLREHKGWFAWRPDGSLRYAENPPKKYEDIVNVDFYAPDAMPDLWVALCEVVMFWAEQGVRLFRVDNPHTKPLPFWQWMIAEVQARYPDTMFLAEAFTRPKVMYRLAKIGFSQSYTYFTWRDTKRELTEYFTELSTTAPKDFFRPHLFVNTPDINPVFLQHAGRAGFLIRAALAATLSGLWGVYNGFELCEAAALPGREEYADSEKYQLRAWDWDRPGNITAEITRLNRLRQSNPALQSHLNVTFETAYNDAILFYSKATEDRGNVLLVAVNLDPRNPQEADIELPLWAWDLPDEASLEVEDLLHNTRRIWTGKRQHIRLEPASPYMILRVRPAV